MANLDPSCFAREGYCVFPDIFTRQEIERMIKDNGGKTSSSVSGKTDFVLVGGNPGSKAGKAEKLGVMIIDEKEFLRLLGGKAQ